MTAGSEMGPALKGLLRTTYATVPKIEERRRMEQNKGMARDMFGKAKASPHPLEKPSLEPPARSGIHGQFRDRAPNSYENKLRHTGIADRHDGAQAIKRWQTGQIKEIDRLARETIEQLREEREIEIIDMSGPVEPEERVQVDVKSYVDDYLAGRGRDSREDQQFAAHCGPEVEEEFHRRREEDLQGPRYDAPTLEPDPPSYEPETYTPSEPTQDHEPDHDYEHGD